MSTGSPPEEALAQVLGSLRSIQQTQSDLVAAVDSLTQRYHQLSGDANVAAALAPSPAIGVAPEALRTSDAAGGSDQQSSDLTLQAPAVPSSPSQRSGLTSRIILTYVHVAEPFFLIRSFSPIRSQHSKSSQLPY